MVVQSSLSQPVRQSVSQSVTTKQLLQNRSVLNHAAKGQHLPTHRLQREVAHHQHVERVAVVAERLRDEAVAEGVEHRATSVKCFCF
jgi:hypothetical protein